MRARSILAAVLGVAALGVATVSALADTGYDVVWRPGGGAQWWRAGLSYDDMKAQDATYFAQGLRIQSLAVRGGKFTTVWRPGGGAQWWRSGMSLDELKAQDSTYFNQGLRITAMALDGGSFAAVWRPGSGAQWWRTGMTFDDFKTQDQTYFDQGLRIAVLEISNGLYTAVWRPGSGAQWWRAGMTGPEMQAQDQIYFSQGLRIAEMAAENGHFTAVWQPGSGAQWWRYGRCFTDFKTEDALFFSQGLRLAFIEPQDGAYGAYNYPWASGVTRTVAQGNNSPPPLSHNGSQAYAFDFSMDSGTQILAARDGTVEWVQSNLTQHFDPSQPVTPANTPFPNGSLKNWGNAVRIRHDNGFTSWYFHIKPNSVLVSVGDKVKAGQPIAKSDNTGRTTGPHLHFQVQADSNNWGQSVPITFQNCEVPISGTNVTSHNPN